MNEQVLSLIHSLEVSFEKRYYLGLMRQVMCTICHTTLPQVDLRASFGTDPYMLSAQELASARYEGLLHVRDEHLKPYQLAVKYEKVDSLIKISEYLPLDPESRLPVTSRMRR